MIIANTPAAIAKEKISVQIKTLNTKWIKLPTAPKTTTAKKIIHLIKKALVKNKV